MNKKTNFEIPTHDPYTGELNPYYEELTGKKNPLIINPNNRTKRLLKVIKNIVKI